MKYVAAAMLVELSGKTPDKKNVKKVLESVGAEVDDAKLFAFLDAIEGKNIKVIQSFITIFTSSV